MCEYCDKTSCILNDFKSSKNNPSYSTGFQVWIYDNQLSVKAIIDNEHILPVCGYRKIKIKYCPMCGRKLVEDESAG